MNGVAGVSWGLPSDVQGYGLVSVPCYLFCVNDFK